MNWTPWLPFLRWWPRVNRQTLRFDAVAGLTGGIILVPQGVAFATVAGMPPEFGLYAAMIPAIVAALWGSSWHLVSGPTTAISIVVFATMSPLAAPGSEAYVKLVLTLTLLVGVFQLLLGLLRMGTLVNFVSHTVVVGFTAGAAILIAASQARYFFGVEIPRGSSVFTVLSELLLQIGAYNPYVTCVAVFTVVVSVVTKRWLPRLPHLIAAMLAGSLLGVALEAALGAGQTGIQSIGALRVGLPPLSMPDFSVSTIEQLIPIAIAVALLSLTEAVSIARSVALKSGQRIDGNQEFIGQGLANISGAFFSGYASSGSFNRTGLNYSAGARTPLAAVFSAAFLFLILLFLAPLAKYLTAPVMAGILFVVAWGLIDFHHIGDIIRSSRQETAVLAVTFLATLTLQLEYAIYLGVLVSMLLYLRRTSRPGLEPVQPVPGISPPVFAPSGESPQSVAGLTIVRLNGSIYFGAVNHVEESLQAADDGCPGAPHLLLIAAGINFIDLAGAQMLANEARRRQALGGGLYLFNMKEEALGTLRGSGQLEAIGLDNIFRLGDDVVGVLTARIAQGQGQGQDQDAPSASAPSRAEAQPAGS
jgi:SulP family sulfate permease